MVSKPFDHVALTVKKKKKKKKGKPISPNSLYVIKTLLQVTQSCPTLCDPMHYTVHGILQARILEWISSLSLLQGTFPTQGLNPGLLHCR